MLSMGLPAPCCWEGTSLRTGSLTQSRRFPDCIRILSQELSPKPQQGEPELGSGWLPLRLTLGS